MVRFNCQKSLSKGIGALDETKHKLYSSNYLFLIFVIALSVFVIVPGIEGDSIVKVILLGALFGFASYATYDLTNYATIEGFPLKMVIIDLIWGTSLGTLTSLLTFLIYKGVFK